MVNNIADLIKYKQELEKKPNNSPGVEKQVIANLVYSYYKVYLDTYNYDEYNDKTKTDDEKKEAIKNRKLALKSEFNYLFGTNILYGEANNYVFNNYTLSKELISFIENIRNKKTDDVNKMMYINIANTLCEDITSLTTVNIDDKYMINTGAKCI